MRVGYARSSQASGIDADNLETQVLALERAGVDRVVKEIISGVSDEKPGLDGLVKELQPGDVLVIVSIDRLARTLRLGLRVAEELQARGVGLYSLAEGHFAGMTGELLLHILLAVAQWEWKATRKIPGGAAAGL